MKKVSILLLAFIFAMLPTAALAEGISLTDDQLDEIAAGDWVVIVDGEEVVDGIHFNNNDIKLEDDSQMEIQAISNANAVDSATATQVNVANATEGLVNVNGRNEATLNNYNPSESGSEAGREASSITVQKGESESFGLTGSESNQFAYSSGFGYKEADLSLVTLDIAAAAAGASETEGKNIESESVFAAALVVDYDNQTNYSKEISGSKSVSGSRNSTLNIAKNYESNCSFLAEKSRGHESEYRKNLSENNHLDLEDTSQKNLKVVSNLNAVGSASAVQANIANATGISGTVTHVNIASASNGM